MEQAPLGEQRRFLTPRPSSSSRHGGPWPHVALGDAAALPERVSRPLLPLPEGEKPSLGGWKRAAAAQRSAESVTDQTHAHLLSVSPFGWLVLGGNGAPPAACCAEVVVFLSVRTSTLFCPCLQNSARSLRSSVQGRV